MKKFLLLLALVSFVLMGCLASAEITVPPNVTVTLQPDYSTVPMTFAEEFGVVPDDGTNQTANIQAAINSFGGKIGILFLKAGEYHFTQLVWKRGVCLVGVGPGTSPPHVGTQLIQMDGYSVDAIITDTGLTQNEFMHWSCIKDLAIMKEAGSTDAKGSGIMLQNRTGEQFVIERVTVSRFAEDGIRLGNGGTPGLIRQINANGNGNCGVNIEPLPGMTARHHGITLDQISGDNNQKSKICIKGIGTAGEYIRITNVKAETASSPTRQQNVIWLENISYATIDIQGVTALAFGPGAPAGDRPIIRIQESFAGAVRLCGVGYDGFTHALIRSGGPNVRIPISAVANGQCIRYAYNEAYQSY